MKYGETFCRESACSKCCSLFLLGPVSLSSIQTPVCLGCQRQLLQRRHRPETELRAVCGCLRFLNRWWVEIWCFLGYLKFFFSCRFCIFFVFFVGVFWIRGGFLVRSLSRRDHLTVRFIRTFCASVEHQKKHPA